MKKGTKNSALAKAAMLARGEPFIVLPSEAAKTFHGYETDMEVLLACTIR